MAVCVRAFLVGARCYLLEIKLYSWVPAKVSAADGSCIGHGWLQVTSYEVGMRQKEGRGAAGTR